jgi:ATP synthase subunit D
VQIKVKQHTDNVAGVKIPKFDFVKESGDSKMDLAGLSAGGMQLGKSRSAYTKTVELLVNIASLQSAFLTLDAAIKTTNRRVNALENVVKPRVSNTIDYIKVRCAAAVLPCTRERAREHRPAARVEHDPLLQGVLRRQLANDLVVLRTAGLQYQALQCRAQGASIIAWTGCVRCRASSTSSSARSSSD